MQYFYIWYLLHCWGGVLLFSHRTTRCVNMWTRFGFITLIILTQNLKMPKVASSSQFLDQHVFLAVNGRQLVEWL